MKSIRVCTCAAAVLASCGLALSVAEPGLPVVLTVREPAGIERLNEPVTTGVPFAAGVLAKDGPLALLDAAGREVPLQTRVLAHWPDGSVKWVLLDFQASAPANGAVQFTLAPRKPTAAPTQAIVVAERPEYLLVDTGVVQVQLNRKRFDLFSAVRAQGSVLLVANDRAGLRLTDLGGKERSSVTDLGPGYSLKAVEVGPLRTVVCAAGEVQATATDRIGFTCWYHFYAGSKFVRVFFTIRNLNGKAFTATDQATVRDLGYQKMVAAQPGNVSLEAADLVVTGALTASKAAYVLGGEPAQFGPLDEGQVTLYQDSSASWPWQAGSAGSSSSAGDGNIVDPRLKTNKDWMAKNAPDDRKHLPYWEFEPGHYKALTDKEQYVGCTFRGYRVSASGAEKPLATGDRAPGWAQLGGTLVGVRWFWQMYPKSLTLSADGTIRIGLWPKEWSSPHVFEGHIHKTHELLFAFVDAIGEKHAEFSFKRFDQRLLAAAPNDYYCASGAFNSRLMPENRKDFAPFEDWALTAVKCGVNPNVNPGLDSSLEVEREKYDQFGVWHFGDTSKRGWRGFGQYLELDIPYCLLAHFARTGKRPFFDEGEVHVRQLMDVPAHGGGYGHQAGESSHYYTTGALVYYYLTGLEFIREGIKTSHDLYARPAPWHARSFAITMWSNLDMYRAFGGPQYLDACRADLAWFAKPQNPITGFRDYGQTNFQEFMLGMMMDSLGRYCVEFPEEQEWRDRLVALSNATIRSHARWPQNNSSCNGHTYAYLFTGRDRHLDFAIELMDASIKKDDPKWPAFRTGTASGKFWSEFGHRLTQTLMWARWYRSLHGTPKPPAAVSDLAAARKGDQIELTWTAPASGSERVDRYVIKIAAKPIKDDLATDAEGATAANWWMTALLKETPPAPQAPGTKEHLIVTAPAGRSYVAVRSLKHVGPITAMSDLSNVAEVP